VKRREQETEGHTRTYIKLHAENDVNRHMQVSLHNRHVQVSLHIDGSPRRERVKEREAEKTRRGTCTSTHTFYMGSVLKCNMKVHAQIAACRRRERVEEREAERIREKWREYEGV